MKNIYMIVTGDDPIEYYHSSGGNINSINTARKFTSNERNNNKKAVLDFNWRYVKICEDGKLVDVPFEAEE